LSPDTRLHIRKAHAYQLALAEIFRENPATQKIWQDLPVTGKEEISNLASRVRGYLGMTLETQSGWKQTDIALKAWRKAIEDKGVFVFKAPFKQKDISGFCLTNSQFPVIYLNNSTTKTRQVFSLLHELCHLLLNQNGISKFDPDYISHLPKGIQHTERLCRSLVAKLMNPSEKSNDEIVLGRWQPALA